jgi:signal transduction histidine kinase
LRNNRKRRLANRELEKRNEVISRQKENLSIAFDMQRRREQELRDANASKDMFFSIIAHDLKNPFSALLGFSGLLREKFESFPPEELRNIFRHMNDASENIYLLLENLLAWSRIQTGRMEVNPRHFDISDMIHDQVASFESHTKDKNITVSVETGNPIKVYSDPAMIAFVIRNLLSNAIKYNNRNGSILIRSEQTSTRVTISIIDNGVGIPIQDIDRLFRIDGRLKTPGTEKETGTGLGLIVSREYIEKNNGTIHAKSDPGEGSSFYFTLPVSNGF